MEQKILFLINREWTSPALDLFMAAMSNFDIWRIPLLVLFVAGFVCAGLRVRMVMIVGVAVVAICDGLVVNGLKSLVSRPRPHQVLPGVRVIDLQNRRPRILALGEPVKVKLSRPAGAPVDGRSFPSGHTANNFSLGVVLSCFFRRWGWLYFLPAAIVGYSRIYVGSHWPSDVVTSMFLAAGTSLLLLAIFEWVWRRHGARLLPGAHGRHPSMFGGGRA